ncbi:tsukushin-like isoform X2 [Megalops cyprinoides]|nr:tsukushin-like isoform X2 [Megalops cyprinoides]XP_036380532.1 tsukushin-like isoform X2 [Megalops cyprinoides]XP_036380533.1 tsukushin-like isoform X2 [Megalops cyprinoides]
MSTFLCFHVFLLFLAVCAVRDCHPGCRCEVESFGLFDSFSLTSVDCSGVGPDVTPIPIPLDTSFLGLSSNSIRTVTDSMLAGPGYTTLASLDLSSNLISKVDSKAFSRLRYLETLDLSHNSLDELADGCFSGLPLAEVDLSDNRLQELGLNIFTVRGRGRPVIVDVSNNLVRAVSRNPHTSPPNLQSLTLAGNQLEAVPRLQGVPLRYLNLDRNPISRIERDSFVELKDLVHLSLSSLPQLSTIQPHSFRDLHNLQVLDLSNNTKLTSLNSDVFHGLVSLKELNLSNSGVMSLPNNILSHMPSLRSITLRENVSCRRTQKQEQFHRHIGLPKSNKILTCDVTGIIS